MPVGRECWKCLAHATVVGLVTYTVTNLTQLAIVSAGQARDLLGHLSRPDRPLVNVGCAFAIHTFGVLLCSSSKNLPCSGLKKVGSADRKPQCLLQGRLCPHLLWLIHGVLVLLPSAVIKYPDIGSLGGKDFSLAPRSR